MLFSFQDNQSVDSLDKVPAQFRALYGMNESGDAYALKSDDPTVAGAVAALLGQSKALSAAREEANKAKAGRVDLSPLSEYGQDVESIGSYIGDLRNQLAEAQKGNKPNVDVDKLKADIAKAHQAEIGKRDAREQALTSQLHNLLVTNKLMQEVVGAGGTPEMLLPALSQQVKAAVNDEGQMQVYVVDQTGSQRYSGATGAEMTISELVSEVRENPVWAAAFKSETKSGGGNKPNNARVPTRQDKGARSSSQKIADGLRARGR